ncbi:YycH family regulatory protein [Oceanobacillus sp. CAU 1775]
MKLETIKSIILVLLIALSLVLSLSLWSYQPNSERALSGDVVTNDINAGGLTDETKRSMVKPSDIVFHTAGEHYGYTEAIERDNLYVEMQEWTIAGFEASVAREQVAATDNRVELQFSDDIPMQIMNSLFNFEQEDIDLPSWSINRIYIHFIEDSKSLKVEFISRENNRVSAGIINSSDSYDRLASLITEIDPEILVKYIAVNENDLAFYIPEPAINLPAYSITPTEIDPTLFVNILFSNPAVVRETSSQSIGETYFTDNRQMSVYQNRMRMEYVNHAAPTVDEDIIISEVDLLDRSIININNHFGWTGNYRLDQVDLATRNISFQLHYDGVPVFSNYKLATIRQAWGIYQNSYQLIEYDRPLFLLERNILFSDTVYLPSGESVLAYLENNTDVSLENIQDIQVSYELSYDLESEYFQLSPFWYKKENNTWQKIIFDEHSSPRGED